MCVSPCDHVCVCVAVTLTVCVSLCVVCVCVCVCVCVFNPPFLRFRRYTWVLLASWLLVL